MTENIPEPTVDEDPDPGNAAGGVDAPEQEVPFPPVPPDEPLSAQMTDEVPDEVQEPEEPDSEADVEDPTAEPTD